MNNAGVIFEKYFEEERNRLKSLRDEESIRRVAAAFGVTYGRVKRDSENTKEQIEHIKELRKIVNSQEKFVAVASVLLESSGKTYVFELDTVELNNGLDRYQERATDMLKQQLRDENTKAQKPWDSQAEIQRIGLAEIFKCMCGCNKFIESSTRFRCSNPYCKTLYLKSNFTVLEPKDPGL